MELKMLNTLCLLLSLIGFVYMDDVPLRPLKATVSNGNNGVVYNITYEGSTPPHVLWEDRRGPLLSYDTEQTSASIGSSALSLPEAHHDLHVSLTESERNMNGFNFFFYDMSQVSLLPGIQVNKSADIIHYPQGRLALNVTAISEESHERRFLRAEFVGVVRNRTHSKIVHIPAFENTIPLIKNEIGRVGKTVMYEVIPPDVEGILILFASMAGQDYEDRGALTSKVVVKNVPAGHQDLFEETETFFGVSLPDKYPAGWCACTSNIRCVIKCDAIGSNVDNIELYFEDMTRAYTIRQDVRHENKYMQSQFVFNDVTKGVKGQLKCQATDGRGVTKEESCNMIVYEVAKITDAEVEYDHGRNESVYRCSATGFPRPVFRFLVDIDDDMYNSVIPTEEEPVDGVYSATYRWTADHTVTTIRCQAVCEFTADWHNLDVPVQTK